MATPGCVARGEDLLSPSKAKPQGMGSGSSPTLGKGDSFCSQQQAHKGAYILEAAEGTVLNSHPAKKVPGTPRNVSWRCQHITKRGCLAHKGLRFASDKTRGPAMDHSCSGPGPPLGSILGHFCRPGQACVQQASPRGSHLLPIPHEVFQPWAPGKYSMFAHRCKQ